MCTQVPAYVTRISFHQWQTWVMALLSCYSNSESFTHAWVHDMHRRPPMMSGVCGAHEMHKYIRNLLQLSYSPRSLAFASRASVAARAPECVTDIKNISKTMSASLPPNY
jgi:hypothetical protein